MKYKEVIALRNAITDALRDMQTNPNDDIQSIWNKHLKEWETSLRMTHDFEIVPCDD